MQTIRILHVQSDENPDLLEACIQDVPSTLFEIKRTRTLKCAQENLYTSQFELILLHLQLSDSSGLDTFLKIQEAFPNIPVVILGSQDSEKTALAAVALGAQDYLLLTTNVTARELLRSITYAIERHRKLSVIQSERENLSKTMDQLACGVLILDRTGKILKMNSHASALLQERDGFLEENGNLRTTKSAEYRPLSEILLAIAGKTGNCSGTRGACLTISRNGYPEPHKVVVTPLHIENVANSMNSATAALFITNSDRNLKSVETILQDRHNLTENEAELLALIMQGISPESAARILGLSDRLVRKLLQTVYHKTGTTRQNDVVRLLLTGSISVADEPR